MKARAFHSMWRQNTLPPDAQAAVDELTAKRAQGLPGYRDGLTLVINSMFERDERGALSMTTSAPVFEEVRTRKQETKVGQYQEGVT